MSRKGLREAYQNSFFSQTVSIFNEFRTADEHFLSSSVTRSFNNDAVAVANDLCTWFRSVMTEQQQCSYYLCSLSSFSCLLFAHGPHSCSGRCKARLIQPPFKQTLDTSLGSKHYASLTASLVFTVQHAALFDHLR